MKPEYDRKLNLTVDVVEIKDGYTFTLHHVKKATTWKVRALGAGFEKVMEIVDKHNEDMKGT